MHVSDMSDIYDKGRFALKAALYHAAKHSAVCRTRPPLAVRAYYSSSLAVPLHKHGDWGGGWVGGRDMGACVWVFRIGCEIGRGGPGTSEIIWVRAAASLACGLCI